MSENETIQPTVSIQRIYVKDSSFEAPNTPDVFNEEYKPQIDIEIQNRSRALGNDLHEVIIRVALNAKQNGRTAFLVEVQQAGIFLAQHMNPDQMGHVLGAYFPSILFPYARETMASLVMKGGFPPVHLAPINFEAAYQQHLQQGTAQGTDASTLKTDEVATQH